jgi:hypothetical protein
MQDGTAAAAKQDVLDSGPDVFAVQPEGLMYEAFAKYAATRIDEERTVLVVLIADKNQLRSQVPTPTPFHGNLGVFIPKLDVARRTF